jgi:AcrR family transcriptional regulator
LFAKIKAVRRTYTLKQRAERQEATRTRIAAAAAELHETLGPARTTISAVAERAGVQRLTVYRHFPDEAALFRACSAHWSAQHPPPALERWAALPAGIPRVRQALTELYAYYARTSAMWTQTYRDLPLVPALIEPMAEWFAYLRAARDVLLEAHPIGRGRRQRLSIALAHAVDFTTWKSLAEHGARRRQAVELMVEWIDAISTR